MEGLKPIDGTYLLDVIRLSPGDRLHRLVARLGDTYIDDLTDDRIVELERMADGFRVTHASGERFPA
jgi:hypothetical protein